MVLGDDHKGMRNEKIRRWDWDWDWVYIRFGFDAGGWTGTVRENGGKLESIARPTPIEAHSASEDAVLCAGSSEWSTEKVRGRQVKKGRGGLGQRPGASERLEQAHQADQNTPGS